ncbi:hypothetical protein BX600DRAFT_444226 [Xylariales sp. PMI_506]|nr:hypothetical protein BX600DRAFT_444226 [Xylariales sp. PMI_506]
MSVQCDETKPTCNQCAKSRRQCPGYKDEFDLVFRNETQATERRARKANKKALQKLGKFDDSSEEEPGVIVMEGYGDAVKSPVRKDVVPAALAVPFETRAENHFVSNFVLLPKQGSTRGFFDFLIPLLKTESPSSHLHRAFNACSLAFLSNSPAVKSARMDMALNEYTHALQSTNIALRDPEMQKADSTLAAVLLLGLFENINSTDIGSLSWGSHTEGAIQLVKQRGRKQLRTKTGLTLFIAVRTQMVIHTLLTGKPPIMGVEWWVNDAVKDQVAARVLRIMIKTAELRAEVTRLMGCLPRTPGNVETMLDMTRRLQTIDQEAVAWMQNLPDHWKYNRAAWEDNVPNGNYANAEVFPGPVDLYTDFWIASVWNLCRTSRLINMSLIVRCTAWVCSPVDYRTTPEYATAARVCTETITDIIASVPYHLGWHLKRKDIMQKANLGRFACGEEDNTKGLAGYFLTWALGCIHCQDYATDAQRTWVDGRLKYIGDELGVKYSYMLAQITDSSDTQMPVRIPSMMIRRDGLTAMTFGTTQNLEKLLSTGKPDRRSPSNYTVHLNKDSEKSASPEPRRVPELLSKPSPTPESPSSNWSPQPQNWSSPV